MPPATWWSSIVTIFFVSLAKDMIAPSSSGFTVDRFITLTLIPSSSNFFAAIRALYRIGPVAMMPTLAKPIEGEKIICALPISNGVSFVVIIGVLLRVSLIYVGSFVLEQAMVAFLASIASQGDITTIFGMTLVRAISSVIWWLPPSGPTETPECVPIILTGLSL